MAKTVKKSAKSQQPTIPKKIFAQASPRSIGGISIFSAGNQINANTFSNFYSETNTINIAVDRLQKAGFEILHVTRMTINIAGNQKTYEQAFNTHLIAEEREVIKPFMEQATATFIDCPDTELPGLISMDNTTFADVLEGIAIEEPRYYMAESMFAPLKSYWHLHVPGDVSLACNADRVHRTGVTGKKIRIAMVDSGWYKHPYFVNRGYRGSPVVLGPGATNPLNDEVGHGTGESANIFSVTPDVQLIPVKMSFTNSKGAFDAAIALNPDIITCSWGSSRRNQLTAADQVLASSIAIAVASGIIVVFSAGNGHWGFPGQHPDVISAGGVFMDSDGSFRASDYASGFMSNIYPNRQVPDLCGLVGMLPRAIYIMLPLEPGDNIDTGNAGGNHPNGDETLNNDGWAAFSGTSAAAPQLAGVAALIKEACPKLKPEEVRDVMKRGARDVTSGRANPSTDQSNTGRGNPAIQGPDNATGFGLVDAYKSVLLAKIRCRPPIEPVRGPIEPIRGPVGPVTGPVPPEPRGPISPQPPVLQPPIPQPPVPIQPIQPRRSETPRVQGLTDQETDALEEMALKGEIDLEDFET